MIRMCPEDPSVELEGSQIAPSRGCLELRVLANAMEINTFVTNPNAHTNKSCSYLQCKLLGRRWRKWEERKLEVSTPGSTGVIDHNYGQVLSQLLPVSHRAPSGIALPQPCRAEPQGSFRGRAICLRTLEWVPCAEGG